MSFYPHFSSAVRIMAMPVVDFSRKGCKIPKKILTNNQLYTANPVTN
jgi:hypothetical protein